MDIEIELMNMLQKSAGVLLGVAGVQSTRVGDFMVLFYATLRVNSSARRLKKNSLNMISAVWHHRLYQNVFGCVEFIAYRTMPIVRPYR